LLFVTGCKETVDKNSLAIASFRGELIYTHEVDAYVSAWQEERYEALERILINKLLLAEAQTQGFSATPNEISGHMEMQRDLYRNDPETTKAFNDTCLEKGISIDEYWDILEKMAIEQMTTLKLHNAFRQDYFGTDDVTNRTYQEYEEAESAWEVFGRELLVKYADDIVIYDD